MAIISGKAFWATLDTPKNKFEPHRLKYSIDLALDKSGVKVMKAEGFNIKNKNDEKGDFVTIYTYEYSSKGKLMPKPRVFDANTTQVHNINIGNGSEVNVSYRKQDYDVGGNKGSRPVLQDVQIISLIEYVAPDEFAKTDGYIAPVPADEEAVLIEEQEELPFSA